MKKIICILLLAVTLFSGVALAADDDNSTDVPPCPEEYEDGLHP